MKKATIYDVAIKSGVSTATVSRVLNNADYPVSQELRAKVLNAVTELAYEPNLLGKYLKTRENREIGVIIPNISNYFYPLLLLGVHDIAFQHGYQIILCNSYRESELEIKNFNFLIRKQVMGILTFPLTTSNDYLHKYVRRGGNVVLLESSSDDEISRVTYNYFQGGYMACQHLLEYGHRRISFAGAPLTRHSRIQQYLGFKQCLLDNGLEPDESLIYIAKGEKESISVYEFENGRALAQMILKSKERPTAVFCVNDMTAIALLQEFHNQGVDVPNDISVVGFDDLNLSAYCIPPLTTVDQHIYEMGTIATKMLIDSIENPSAEISTIQLEPTLVLRESTRKI